jgi:hypothetical protein
MTTTDRFAPNHPVPVIMSQPAEEHERSGFKIAVLATIALVCTAAAIMFAIALTGNSVVFLGNVKASPVSGSAPRNGSDQSMPSVESTASAQAFVPSAKEAPTGEGLLTAFKNAFESQTGVDQPPARELFNQFEAWAAEEHAQANVPPPYPLQDGRAQVVQNARTPLPKPRPIPSEQTARVQDPALRPVRSLSSRN